MHTRECMHACTHARTHAHMHTRTHARICAGFGSDLVAVDELKQIFNKVVRACMRVCVRALTVHASVSARKYFQMVEKEEKKQAKKTEEGTIRARTRTHMLARMHTHSQGRSRRGNICLMSRFSPCKHSVKWKRCGVLTCVRTRVHGR